MKPKKVNMKNLIFSLSLLSVIILASSFKGIETRKSLDPVLNGGPFAARIDGFPFDAHKDNKYEATIKDGSTAEVILYGNDVKDKNGNYNAQKIGVQFSVKDGVVGLAPGSKVSYEFNQEKFYSNPSSTELTIKKAVWSADHKSMTFSADFRCMVEKPRTSEDYTPSLGIKGTVENITIAVPASAQGVTSNGK